MNRIFARKDRNGDKRKREKIKDFEAEVV